MYVELERERYKKLYSEFISKENNIENILKSYELKNYIENPENFKESNYEKIRNLKKIIDKLLNAKTRIKKVKSNTETDKYINELKNKQEGEIIVLYLDNDNNIVNEKRIEPTEEEIETKNIIKRALFTDARSIIIKKLVKGENIYKENEEKAKLERLGRQIKRILSSYSISVLEVAPTIIKNTLKQKEGRDDIDISEYKRIISKLTDIEIKEIDKTVKNNNDMEMFLKKPQNYLTNIKDVYKIEKLTQLALLTEKYANKKDNKIDTPKKVKNHLIEYAHKTDQEYFIAIYCDSDMKELDTKVTNIGTLTEAIVCNRKILKEALKLNAKNLIIAHNHPGKTLVPSKADIRLTKKLEGNVSGIGIKMEDHIILTSKSYTSFKKELILEETKINYVENINIFDKNNIFERYKNEIKDIKKLSEKSIDILLEYNDKNIHTSLTKLKKRYKELEKYINKHEYAKTEVEEYEELEYLFNEINTKKLLNKQKAPIKRKAEQLELTL